MGANVVSPVFIGRRDELASLAGQLARASAIDPAFALIGGEAGVGKTRLTRELASLAASQDCCVLTGQCVELGGEGLPLAPLADALRTLARTMPPDLLADVLGPAAPALSRLLPELAKAASAVSSSPAGPTALAGDDVSKAQLLEHVLGTLDRLSGVRPVLLAVEDLHWADRSTLDLMAFLFRSLRQSRVMIAVTYRSDELHRRHPLRPLLTSWERDRSINRIDLSRFSRDEVAAQLGAILGQRPAPAVTDTVFDRSGGNAYLVEELAGAVSAGGDPADLPPSLADVLLSRVDALTANAQKLLRTASVAGRVARLPQHVALAGSLALVGLPTLAMPAAHWAPAAVLLAGFTGAGALCVEIMTETGLQRMLNDEVFGRAYGLALPASIAGIAVGSLIAPALVSAFGQSAALLVCGAVVTAYCAVAWRSRPAGAAAPAIARPAVTAPMAGAPTVVMPVIAPAGPVPLPALTPGRDALIG